MTVHDMLAEGRLADAVASQEATVGAAPADPGARRLLVDLLVFAGRFDDARAHLDRIGSDEPEWPEVARGLLRLFRSERRRTAEGAPRPSPRTRRRNTPRAAGGRCNSSAARGPTMPCGRSTPPTPSAR
ncbi:tetratricopeptide repeat protein [Frigoriglobus tundricola]|uniref:Protein of avirulence locus ImpE n=1 Tax=Frigoriglobus tundricola TaxID=2774151 RepID=A0A6M5YR03_9BACT|nr:tetratricopeptide repeat protein [Frigoriglobus tundricola]QJW95723.1 Protein of avirulence locus ImpE [Frigoriglobus tundricola]